MLLPVHASAQGKRMAVQEKDSIPFINGVELSADLVGPMMYAIGDYGHFQAALRVNILDRYFPIVEIGYAKCDAEDDGTRLAYKTAAPYGKAGCDFNLLRDKHDDYRLYAGLRYAFTSYKYDLARPAGVEDPVWGGLAEYSVSDIKCSYHWAEAVFGVQAKIFSPLHLGWSIRYMKRIARNEGEMGKSWYVPGFGKSDGSGFGATFNVIIAI